MRKSMRKGQGHRYTSRFVSLCQSPRDKNSTREALSMEPPREVLRVPPWTESRDTSEWNKPKEKSEGKKKTISKSS